MESDTLIREYLLLGLRFDRIEEGYVDSFTGDQALRRAVAAEPAPDPAELTRTADLADLRLGLLDVDVSGWREGGQVELHVGSGAFHRCDDWVPKAVISRAAHRARVSWLRRMPATAEGRDTR